MVAHVGVEGRRNGYGPQGAVLPFGHELVTDRSASDHDLGSAFGDRAVIDRLQRLRVVLPALAHEASRARRELARLRCENARLARRVHELESAASSPTPVPHGDKAPTPS